MLDLVMFFDGERRNREEIRGMNIQQESSYPQNAHSARIYSLVLRARTMRIPTYSALDRRILYRKKGWGWCFCHGKAALTQPGRGKNGAMPETVR